MSFSCDPVFIWPRIVNTDINAIYMLIKIPDVMYDVQKNCTRKMELSEKETFIDLWQQKPCLYDISNQSYSNKNKKKLDMRSVERGMFPITTSTINELLRPDALRMYKTAIFPLPV